MLPTAFWEARHGGRSSKHRGDESDSTDRQRNGREVAGSTRASSLLDEQLGENILLGNIFP